MKPAAQNGFTLIELAVVLMIVGLLLGGMLVPLTAQLDQRNITETRKTLDDIQQALIGYAIINGRLPCPAISTSNGAEKFASTHNAADGQCYSFYDGFVPAATLGIASTVDNQGNTGFAVDAWGNRIHYAVTPWNYVFTKTDGMKSAGISSLSPNLLVCSTATNITSSACDTGKSLTPSGVPAVIFSTGKNGAQGSAGIDETANIDGNLTFVSHPPVSAGATNGAFDDIVTWISPNILLNRMVAAGKLP